MTGLPDIPKAIPPTPFCCRSAFVCAALRTIGQSCHRCENLRKNQPDDDRLLDSQDRTGQCRGVLSGPPFIPEKPRSDGRTGLRRLFMLPKASEATPYQSGGHRPPGILSVLICTPVLVISPAKASQAHKTTDLLTFIRHIEAGGGGYDAFEHRISVPPPKRLTAMRVDEVLAWQTRVRAAGNPSTAAGGYQIIRQTLGRMVKNGTVSGTALFNADTQDRLARSLIGECGSSAQRVRFANCLAGIWAALPLVSGPNRGRSAHHGIAGNRAHTTPKTILALLAGKPVSIGRTSAARLRNEADAGSGADLRYSTVATPPEPSKPSRESIGAAMRQARKDGTLTPSVRLWKVDPYAQE